MCRGQRSKVEQYRPRHGHGLLRWSRTVERRKKSPGSRAPLGFPAFRLGNRFADFALIWLRSPPITLFQFPSTLSSDALPKLVKFIVRRSPGSGPGIGPMSAIDRHRHIIKTPRQAGVDPESTYAPRGSGLRAFPRHGIATMLRCTSALSKTQEPLCHADADRSHSLDEPQGKMDVGLLRDNELRLSYGHLNRSAPIQHSVSNPEPAEQLSVSQSPDERARVKTGALFGSIFSCSTCSSPGKHGHNYATSVCDTLCPPVPSTTTR